MAQTPDMESEPPQVRQLRLLVMVLIVVLILGFLTIVATIVIRLGIGAAPGQGVLVRELNLPAGEILATGQGPGTLHVLLRSPDGDDALHIFDASNGAVKSVTAITRD
ncbi:MAG: DUF6476 family protein [Paracoccaceae bacterium]